MDQHDLLRGTLRARRSGEGMLAAHRHGVLVDDVRVVTWPVVARQDLIRVRVADGLTRTKRRRESRSVRVAYRQIAKHVVYNRHVDQLSRRNRAVGHADLVDDLVAHLRDIAVDLLRHVDARRGSARARVRSRGLVLVRKTAVPLGDRGEHVDLVVHPRIVASARTGDDLGVVGERVHRHRAYRRLVGLDIQRDVTGVRDDDLELRVLVARHLGRDARLAHVDAGMDQHDLYPVGVVLSDRDVVARIDAGCVGLVLQDGVRVVQPGEVVVLLDLIREGSTLLLTRLQNGREGGLGRIGNKGRTIHVRQKVVVDRNVVQVEVVAMAHIVAAVLDADRVCDLVADLRYVAVDFLRHFYAGVGAVEVVPRGLRVHLRLTGIQSGEANAGVRIHWNVDEGRYDGPIHAEQVTTHAWQREVIPDYHRLPRRNHEAGSVPESDRAGPGEPAGVELRRHLRFVPVDLRDCHAHTVRWDLQLDVVAYHIVDIVPGAGVAEVTARPHRVLERSVRTIVPDAVRTLRGTSHRAECDGQRHKGH